MRSIRRLTMAVIYIFLLVLLGGCRQVHYRQLPTIMLETTPPRPGVLVGAPTLCQYPDYPTGCEAVATVMALHYVGEGVSVDTFIDEYLPCSSDFYYKQAQLYGPDPYQVFAGNPRTQRSYGCMAPVIKKALLSYFGNGQRVIDTSDTPLSTLCREYIDNGLPVILWATSGMTPVKEGDRWRLADGREFTWPSGEHCLLLVGYNDTRYFFNDPKTGKTVSFGRTSAEQRYEDMGCQSLVVTY